MSSSHPKIRPDGSRCQVVHYASFNDDSAYADVHLLASGRAPTLGRVECHSDQLSWARVGRPSTPRRDRHQRRWRAGARGVASDRRRGALPTVTRRRRCAGCDSTRAPRPRRGAASRHCPSSGGSGRWVSRDESRRHAEESLLRFAAERLSLLMPTQRAVVRPARILDDEHRRGRTEHEESSARRRPLRSSAIHPPDGATPR